MRRAAIYYKESLAGVLEERPDGYLFAYRPEYLKAEGSRPVSLTMPLRGEPYRSNVIFPFFDGLIPEGWLLDVASRNWKIDREDRMGLLMACCADCIGAVSVKPLDDDSHE